MDFKDWFSFEGKIDKGTYIKRMLICFAICVGLGWIPIIGWALALVASLVEIFSVIRRLRGMGRSPWMALFLLIPIVNLVMVIYWMFPE